MTPISYFVAIFSSLVAKNNLSLSLNETGEFSADILTTPAECGAKYSLSTLNLTDQITVVNNGEWREALTNKGERYM